LALPQAGAATITRLVDAAGTPRKALRLPFDRAQALRLRPATLQAYVALGGCISADAARQRDWLLENEVQVIARSDPEYPPLLREIPRPPPFLFLRGSADLIGLPQVALVGSRSPTPAGREFAAVLAGKPVRVALLEVDYGDPEAPQRLRVQVAKSLAVQQRIARELVADMLLPLLVLGVLLGLLVYAGIGRGLQPLKRLQAQLGDRSGRPVAALSPIELTQAPQEVLALAAAVNQLLEAVRRSLNQEKRFISDAAHQLRTPLAGLISQTELALQEHDPAALQERLSKVHAGALRSAHLVHQLLALARTEGEIQGRPLDMAALAREVAREWTPRAVAAGVDLGYEGADSLSLLGEKLLLREALSNLIDNALHYAGRGATVTLRVRALPGQVLVEVEDNGPGLPAADRARIFERFWRASERQGGCGLGLAIVAEIARQHGGTADVEAVQPHGLRVCIRLPATGEVAGPT
jgi:two-component system sensor histidine kinase TctE